MNIQDVEFFKELLAMFKLESKEHLATIDSGLNELEEMPSSEKRKEILETVFRAAHSLKGAARTVGLMDIEPFGQSLESLFGVLKQKEINMTAQIYQLLHSTVDNLGTLIFTMDEQGKLKEDKSKLSRIMDDVNQYIRLLNA